jgi:uncharacterized protein YqeY
LFDNPIMNRVDHMNAMEKDLNFLLILTRKHRRRRRQHKTYNTQHNEDIDDELVKECDQFKEYLKGKNCEKFMDQ